MSTTRVIYIISRPGQDETRALLVVREAGVPVEVTDFGYQSAFDVADILEAYTGLEFSVGRILTQTALNRQLREEREAMTEVTNSMGGDASVMQGMN